MWDSFAICEYLAERYADLDLWPKQFIDRVNARSIVAEMHSGFSALRRDCPMNVEADLSEIGERLWKTSADLRLDIQRIECIWNNRKYKHGYLFGDNFTIADAFFAPVVSRIKTYNLPVQEDSRIYMNKIFTTSAMIKWVELAQLEHRFVDCDEPYRTDR